VKSISIEWVTSLPILLFCPVFVTVKIVLPEMSRNNSSLRTYIQYPSTGYDIHLIIDKGNWIFYFHFIYSSPPVCTPSRNCKTAAEAESDILFNLFETDDRRTSELVYPAARQPYCILITYMIGNGFQSNITT